MMSVCVPPRPYVGNCGKYCKEFPTKTLNASFNQKNMQNNFPKKNLKTKWRPRKLFTVPPRKIYSDPVSEKRANTAKNVRIIESKLPTKQRATKISEKNFTQKIISTGIIHSITVTLNTFVRVIIAKQCLPNPAKNSFQTCSVTAKKVRNR